MRFLTNLFAVVIVLAIGWISIEIILEVLRLYGIAESDVKLGVMTAGGSALAFVINNAVQASRERKARLFESKREAYGHFFKAYMSFFHRMSTGEKVETEEMVRSIQSLSRDVMTWGSAETVNAYNKFQQENAKPTDDNRIPFSRNEEFLRALRKDLGHKDGALDKFALTKMILKAEEHKGLN